MKGHTLPGINQKAQTSSLKDGRSKSSAFQMESPLHEETEASKLGTNTWSSPELGEEKDKYAGSRQGENQGGMDYMTEQLMFLAKRRKAKKELEDNPSNVLDVDEDGNKIEVTGDAEDNSNAEFQSPTSDQFESDEEANIKNDINESLSDQVIMSTPSAPEANTMDYSGSSKNEMTDMRRDIKDSGEDFDPENNPEHAEIQNKINELYGDSKRH